VVQFKQYKLEGQLLEHIRPIMVNNTSSILILQKLWLVSEKALFFMLGYCAKFGQKVL